jgi:DNA-binding response OmpR family regulator
MPKVEAKTVLLVEPDPELRDRLVASVRALDCIAIPASTVENARVILQKVRADLLVLAFGSLEPVDIAELKATYPEIPVVVVADTQQRASALSAGADEAVARPITVEEVETLVRRFVHPLSGSR